MHATAQKWMNDFVELLLPARCPVSGDRVEEQGMLAPQIWREIDFIAEPYCTCCGHPFAYGEHDEHECAHCIVETPPFTSARAAVLYNDVSRSLVLGFKHADKTHAIKAFMPWLQKAGAEMLSQADLLIPVPLHPFRLMMRRYNQAALLAGGLSKETGVPTLLGGLKRTRHTQSQGHMKSAERHENVKRAFAVPDKNRAAVKDKKIILIDDVYTTGATAKECTRALLKAGASEIHILTIARVTLGDGLG